MLNEEIQILTQGCTWSQGAAPTEAGEGAGFLCSPGFGSGFRFCRSFLRRNLSILPPHERRLLDEEYHRVAPLNNLPLALEGFISLKNNNEIVLLLKGEVFKAF